MRIHKLVPNPNNPRFIRDDKFEQLKESIKKFPKMMSMRPIIIDDQNVILGGNMRYKALQELGFEVLEDDWVKKVSDLTEEEKKQFIVVDNVSYGEWDWEVLAAWEQEDLKAWGLEVWQAPEEVDYSVLDDSNDQKLDDLEESNKRAILIEFEGDDYDEASILVKLFRDRGDNVGKMLIKNLRHEASLLTDTTDATPAGENNEIE